MWTSAPLDHSSDPFNKTRSTRPCFLKPGFFNFFFFFFLNSNKVLGSLSLSLSHCKWQRFCFVIFVELLLFSDSHFLSGSLSLSLSLSLCFAYVFMVFFFNYFHAIFVFNTQESGFLKESNFVFVFCFFVF